MGTEFRVYWMRPDECGIWRGDRRICTMNAHSFTGVAAEGQMAERIATAMNCHDELLAASEALATFVDRHATAVDYQPLLDRVFAIIGRAQPPKTLPAEARP